MPNYNFNNIYLWIYLNFIVANAYNLDQRATVKVLEDCRYVRDDLYYIIDIVIIYTDLGNIIKLRI
jgi:hypothetical protein